MSETEPTEKLARPHEPAFNAPWAVVVLSLAILGSYAVQGWVAPAGMAGEIGGFSIAALEQGRWWTLVTCMFVHGGWLHAGMNAVGALAFGAPVARLFGASARGVLVFVLFFLFTGMVASLGWSLLHLDSQAVLIGASGGVAGLMGGAARLYGRERGLAPIFSRNPMGFAAGWVIANVLLGLTGLTPGMEGAVVAWEAHIIGFAAGLFLVGPAASHLAGWRPPPRLPWGG